MASIKDYLNIGNSKPKELSEAERVEINMKNAEESMRQKFIQLGQLFFVNNQDLVFNEGDESTENKYAEIIHEIKKLDENRKGFYAHKLRLEGNMLCSSCGKTIPFGSVYCQFCGKRADGGE